MSGRILSTAHGTNRAAFGPTEWTLFLLSSGIWGASFLFMAIGLDSFLPGLVTLFRVGLGALTLALFPGGSRHVEGHDWPRLLVVAALWMALPLTLFPLAQQWIDSAVAGMVNGATPILTAVVGSLMLGELPRRRQAAGLMVGFVGVVLIGIPTAGSGRTAALGVLLVVAAIACYGLAINIVAPLQQRYGGLPVLRRVQVVAALMVLPFGLVSVPGSSFSWPALLAMLAVGVLGTGVAFVAAANLIGRVGPTRASTLTYVIPVTALVLGVVFRNEQVGLIEVAGCALVIAGAAFTSRREL